MNFDFFHQVLSEHRSYDYSALDSEFIYREASRMKELYPEAAFLLPSEGPVGNWGRPSTTVCHLAAPPDTGLETLEEAFEIKLPSDFKEFYRIHNEALILGRNPILLMSPKQIEYVSNDLRDAHDVSDDLPRHVIRFGWLGTDSYFLLRFDSGRDDWEVMLSSYSHATDEELQKRTAWATSTDKTFTLWLRRMLETDGAPLHPSRESDFDFSNRRVA